MYAAERAADGVRTQTTERAQRMHAVPVSTAEHQHLGSRVEHIFRANWAAEFVRLKETQGVRR